MTGALEQRIGYTFRNRGLLELALKHPSLAKLPSNQRLEFVGDSILGAVIATLLYEIYPNENEGDLAKRLAGLVRGETLATFARELGLGKEIAMSESEVRMGGRDNDSNLEDALEALIGAIFLDGGMDAAKAFITPRWQPLAERTAKPPKDAKTALQEWAQGEGLPIPAYRTVSQTGSAHAPAFTVEVTLPGYDSQQATAASKRAAEQAAAEALLGKVGETHG